MENFVNRRIWASTFVGEFFRRCKSTEKACDMLLLEEHDLSESKYKIISNGSLYDTQELNTKNISQGFLIYEKLSI